MTGTSKHWSGPRQCGEPRPSILLTAGTTVAHPVMPYVPATLELVSDPSRSQGSGQADISASSGLKRLSTRHHTVGFWAVDHTGNWYCAACLAEIALGSLCEHHTHDVSYLSRRRLRKKYSLSSLQRDCLVLPHARVPQGLQ